MSETPIIVIVISVELIVLAAAAGAVLSDLWLLPSPPAGTPQPLLTQARNTLWRAVAACVTLLVVAMAAELLLRTANMSGLPLTAAYTEIHTVLFKTHYGFLWLWRAGALLGLAVTPLFYWRDAASRIGPGSALLILIIIVPCLSASGHAGDDGMLSVANVANSLHILGALMWGGGIIAFAFFILPPLTRGRAPDRALLAAASLRLSTLAAIGLGVTILPGIYNAWQLVGSWHGLWTTRYGQLLMTKIMLIAGMIGLGAVHRYRYVPSLQVNAGRPRPATLLPLPRFLGLARGDALIMRFRRSLTLEAILLAAVLGAASTLSQEVPATHAEHNPVAGQVRTETRAMISSTLTPAG
jgi:putative copper resistance protein D